MSAQRGAHCLAIGYVAFDEFDVISDPGRLSVAMGLRLEVIQDADAPAFALQQIGDMRADEPGPAGYESSFADATSWI